MRPYRKERVASAIQVIVSEAIGRRLNDPRVARFTTVTRVEVSADLLVAKVFLSVLGDETEEAKTLRAIRHAGGYLQNFVARELNLRQCPELRFFVDAAAKEARRTLQLLDEIRRTNRLTAGGDSPAAGEDRSAAGGDQGPAGETE